MIRLIEIIIFASDCIMICIMFGYKLILPAKLKSN